MKELPVYGELVNHSDVNRVASAATISRGGEMPAQMINLTEAVKAARKNICTIGDAALYANDDEVHVFAPLAATDADMAPVLPVIETLKAGRSWDTTEEVDEELIHFIMTLAA
jgi:hypothetical protein